MLSNAAKVEQKSKGFGLVLDEPDALRSLKRKEWYRSLKVQHRFAEPAGLRGCGRFVYSENFKQGTDWAAKAQINFYEKKKRVRFGNVTSCSNPLCPTCRYYKTAKAIEETNPAIQAALKADDCRVFLVTLTAPTRRIEDDIKILAESWKTLAKRLNQFSRRKKIETGIKRTYEFTIGKGKSGGWTAHIHIHAILIVRETTHGSFNEKELKDYIRESWFQIYKAANLFVSKSGQDIREINSERGVGTYIYKAVFEMLSAHTKEKKHPGGGQAYFSWLRDTGELNFKKEQLERKGQQLSKEQFAEWNSRISFYKRITIAFKGFRFFTRNPKLWEQIITEQGIVKETLEEETPIQIGEIFNEVFRGIVISDTMPNVYDDLDRYASGRKRGFFELKLLLDKWNKEAIKYRGNNWALEGLIAGDLQKHYGYADTFSKQANALNKIADSGKSLDEYSKEILKGTHQKKHPSLKEKHEALNEKYGARAIELKKKGATLHEIKSSKRDHRKALGELILGTFETL